MAESAVKEPRGTGWRIWDLHVHTPASIVQGYGGDTDEAWARFIDDLEELPEDVSVIGINDYWFLDGYKRIIAERNNGRLQNLDAVFPVVEMRLDQFGGTEGNLSRVNLHVIFDPAIEVEVIEAQFLNALNSQARLSPSYQQLGWKGVITRDSLADFGQRIKQSVPQDRINQYGTDLEEGFNNLNVSLAAVQSILSGPYFQGKALLGIGKTEWAGIKWTDQSIAAKKTVINSADLVFTAFSDVTRWTKDVSLLRDNNVTHKLLDCSDAHHFSNSSQDMRLGKCQTWMNTSPTFAGLTYALREFDRRVFVGLEPPALARVRKNPERFISSVTVGSNKQNYNLFDYSIPLNAGFVAVVGNKGQGKSALLDCIALAGNSSRNKEFAFLNTSRFLRTPSAKIAEEYSSELEWANAAVRRVKLTDEHDRSAPVYVEYLPQKFVERVCNIDPTVDEVDEFESELRAVLFTHISEEQRSGEKTFDDLLSQKKRVTQETIDRLREELGELVSSYTSLANFRAENLATDVDGRLALKEEEVQAATTALDVERERLEQIDSESNGNLHLSNLKQRAEVLASQGSSLAQQRTENEQSQAQAQQNLAQLEVIAQRAASLHEDATALNTQISALVPDAEPYISVDIHAARYEAWRSAAENQVTALQNGHEELLRKIEIHEEERGKNDDELAVADSVRERVRQRMLQAQERLASLIGDEGDQESLTGLKELRLRISEAPADMDRLREALIEKSGQIHSALNAQLAAVESLYAPASLFIETSDVVRNVGLEFNAELRILPSWRNIPNSLDGRKNSEYIDWLADLPQHLEDADWEMLGPILQEALIRLEQPGSPGEPFRNPATALRTNATLREFMISMLDLSWLEVRFGLTGDGRPLSQLSPGQRGLLLALFYLVVDRRTTPLLLDQPEENLDNETIASKLVPALHEAAGRRQTIVVTHNANLAVVGDADQIIHCQLREDQFTVSTGSIADLDVAKFALNVLEGTKPAFDNRRDKYEAFPELALQR